MLFDIRYYLTYCVGSCLWRILIIVFTIKITNNKQIMQFQCFYLAKDLNIACYMMSLNLHVCGIMGGITLHKPWIVFIISCKLGIVWPLVVWDMFCTLEGILPWCIVNILKWYIIITKYNVKPPTFQEVKMIADLADMGSTHIWNLNFWEINQKCQSSWNNLWSNKSIRPTFDSLLNTKAKI